MTGNDIAKPAGDRNVVEFPKPDSPEERARRLQAEVERLASLPVVEWRFYLESDDVAEKHGITRAALKAMIEATIKQREKKEREDKAEDRQRKRHVEKKETASKRERERKQEKREKEAERKAKAREREKAKAFKELARLPSKEQDARLIKLAKRLDEDLETLRAEFEVFLGDTREEREAGHIEPWPSPVDAKHLLSELTAQVRRYVVLSDDAATAVALWTMFAWVHETATRSPLLIVTSAEAESGKTTLLGVIGFLTPRPYPAGELTGPALFRLVDQLRPTLMIDEADQLFQRKSDLSHVVNLGWSRGTKIPRIVHGVPRAFDPFCAKVIGMNGLAVPDALSSRGIIVKLWRKTDAEKVADFGFSDDAEFEKLRRQLLRWSGDNETKIRSATPALPLGFGNRAAANWKLLFAIAELAGCLEQAHRAAIALSQKRQRVSGGVRLLAALQPIFAKHKVLASADVVKKLAADEDGEWCEYRGGGPITKRQLALLLDPYDIHPIVVHPTKGTTASVRGYRAEQFADVFVRYLPNNRTTVQPPRKKPRK